MRHSLLILSLVASSSALAEPPAAERPQPTASQESIYRALSVRDPVPSCETVEALSSAPVGDLLFVVDHAAQPPWAAMRAAQCLVRRHSAEIQPQIEGWVSTEETRGLALMTLSFLDSMPIEVALPVAQAALAGPLSSEARPRVQKAETPAIKVLAR